MRQRDNGGPNNGYTRVNIRTAEFRAKSRCACEYTWGPSSSTRARGTCSVPAFVTSYGLSSEYTQIVRACPPSPPGHRVQITSWPPKIIDKTFIALHFRPLRTPSRKPDTRLHEAIIRRSPSFAKYYYTRRVSLLIPSGLSRSRLPTAVSVRNLRRILLSWNNDGSENFKFRQATLVKTYCDTFSTFLFLVQESRQWKEFVVETKTLRPFRKYENRKISIAGCSVEIMLIFRYITHGSDTWFDYTSFSAQYAKFRTFLYGTCLKNSKQRRHV